MNKFIYTLIFTFICATAFAQESDTTMVALDEIVVSSFYQSSSTTSSVVTAQDIVKTNYGQEPSHVFSKMPSIISLNDNGTEYAAALPHTRNATANNNTFNTPLLLIPLSCYSSWSI